MLQFSPRQTNRPDSQGYPGTAETLSWAVFIVCSLYQSELDENQIQMAGDDVGLPEDLQKMVAEDQVEEEDKDSILGQLQNIQNMDMDAIKEKAQATFTEMKQAAEQKCSVM